MVKKMTKYGRIEAELRSRILEGQYGKAGKIPPEKELAEEFGVSYLTARKAVCNLVDCGLLERRFRRGTFVRTTPVAMDVGLMAFHVTDDEGYHVGIPQHALEVLTRLAVPEGRQVRAQLMQESLPDPDQVLAELEVMKVGAVGMLGFLDHDREFILRIAERVPVVLFSKPLSDVSLPFSMPDTRKAAQLVAEYLAKKKWRRIAEALGLQGHSARTQLAEDVRLELEYDGILVDDDHSFMVRDYQTEDAAMVEWLDHMLDLDPMPEAFLLYNDPSCRYLDSEIRKRGLQPGKDVEIVAFQSQRDDGSQDVLWPTVMLNYPDATEIAATMLMDAVRNGTVPTPLRGYSKPRLVIPDRA